MKKLIITSAVIALLVSCKSDVEKEIDRYDLNKAKLEYLEALMKTREDLKYKENLRLIDSMIKEERKNKNVNSN